MRDTLIGITTMTLLFGIVWLSQNKVNANKSIASKYEKPIAKENYENIQNGVDINEENYSEKLNTDTINSCGSCNSESGINDNFTFSEAFKLCRECLGDEGVFVWKGNSYLTKVKESKVQMEDKNLVVKEDIISPPPEDSKETVSSN
tara:strand:+ start:18 stop:458 length:441 start_codon:yes stop_codon:yes gene_type:complete